MEDTGSFNRLAYIVGALATGMQGVRASFAVSTLSR